MGHCIHISERKEHPRFKKIWIVLLLLFSSGEVVSAQSVTVEERVRPPVSLHYRTTVSPGEFDHYTIQIEVRHVFEPRCHFFLPRWAPGYYHIQDWHERISNVRAEDLNGEPLAIERLGDSEWIVSNGTVQDILFHYSVDAATPVRDGIPQLNNMHYLHSEGGLVDGPRSWMYLDGYTARRIMVHFDLPPEWVVATGLNPTPDPKIFWAEDYDWLIDCPTLVGLESNIHRWHFLSWGVPFTVAYDAAGQQIKFDRETFVESIKRICDCQAAIFGGFPFEHYTFIYDNGGGGGLEHLRSTTIGGMASRLEGDPYALWNITAHEFYHAWNVKRIRPKVLGPFDYQRMNRTQSLWVSEGMTETYTAFTGIRAGFISPQEYYNVFAGSIAGWMGNPAQPYAPPARMSWTTWDSREKNPQGTISYYTQGEVLGMALDLIIREATDNRHSLDDVMRILMWEYGGENLEKPGFGTEEIIYICEDVAGIELYDFFEDYVLGTEKCDWAEYLGYAGLSYEEKESKVVQRGFTCVNTLEGPVVRYVSPNQAAAGAGLRRNDRVISVGGNNVSNVTDLYSVITEIGEGGRLRMVVERDGGRHNLEWRVESTIVLSVEIKEVSGATPRQLLIRNGFVTGAVDREGAE